MAKRGPQPKTGKMEPPAYSLCERVPDPPESLSNVGRALWNEVASELHSRGILTFVSMAPLEIYCDAYACARRARTFQQPLDLLADRGIWCRSPAAVRGFRQVDESRRVGRARGELLLYYMLGSDPALWPAWGAVLAAVSYA